MKMSRVWAMANSKTFDVKPIGDFVRQYLDASRTSVARPKRNMATPTHTMPLRLDSFAPSSRAVSFWAAPIVVPAFSTVRVVCTVGSVRTMVRSFTTGGAAGWRRWRRSALAFAAPPLFLFAEKIFAKSHRRIPQVIRPVPPVLFLRPVAGFLQLAALFRRLRLVRVAEHQPDAAPDDGGGDPGGQAREDQGVRVLVAAGHGGDSGSG